MSLSFHSSLKSLKDHIIHEEGGRGGEGGVPILFCVTTISSLIVVKESLNIHYLQLKVLVSTHDVVLLKVTNVGNH